MKNGHFRLHCTVFSSILSPQVFHPNMEVKKKKERDRDRNSVWGECRYVKGLVAVAMANLQVPRESPPLD